MLEQVLQGRSLDQPDLVGEALSETPSVSMLDAEAVEGSISERGVYVLPEDTNGLVSAETDTGVVFMGVMDLSGLQVAFSDSAQTEIPVGSATVMFVPGSDERGKLVRDLGLAYMYGEIPAIEGISRKLPEVDAGLARRFAERRKPWFQEQVIEPASVRKVVITIGVRLPAGR